MTAPGFVWEGPVPEHAGLGPCYRGQSERRTAGAREHPPLSNADYVEEEYFVSGGIEGRSYRVPVLVRRPRQSTRFSGLVAVETVHVLGLFPLWDTCRTWMDGGHGWAAIASQRAALERLRAFNPRRYGDCYVPSASGATQPAAFMEGGPQDHISQAIINQVGAQLKLDGAKGPFAYARVSYLVLGGSSQTGATTLRHLTQAHVRLGDGGPVFDGYFPMLAIPYAAIAPVDAAVMHVITEGDLLFFSGHDVPLVFRDDADLASDRYRHVQIAGASHTLSRGLDDPIQVAPTLAGILEPHERLSQFPAGEMLDACASQLVAWIVRGQAPVSVERLRERDKKIMRDGYGNALGGLRSPYVDMPRARYVASAPAPQGDTRRSMLGLEEPLPAATLRQLYATPSNYMSEFQSRIDAMVEEGRLLARDANTLKADEVKCVSF